jgi:hypothetical protein
MFKPHHHEQNYSRISSISTTRTGPACRLHYWTGTSWSQNPRETFELLEYGLTMTTGYIWNSYYVRRAWTVSKMILMRQFASVCFWLAWAGSSVFDRQFVDKTQRRPSFENCLLRALQQARTVQGWQFFLITSKLSRRLAHLLQPCGI